MDRSAHLVIVGALVKNGEGKVLLVRHHKRGWEIPQGHVDEGEGVIDALHREMMEEAGIRIKVDMLATVWSKLSPPTSVIFNFIGTYTGGELTTSDETPDLGWFETDKVLEMVTEKVSGSTRVWEKGCPPSFPARHRSICTYPAILPTAARDAPSSS